MVKHDVEVESSGECVDEIDKLTEVIGEMQLKQEDRSYVHASNELHLHVFRVVAAYILVLVLLTTPAIAVYFSQDLLQHDVDSQEHRFQLEGLGE
ncbi:hypothetical protein Tco_0098158 [Tanacetum coccineum]